PSAAARVGMTSYVVFDPMWADSALCQPGETPLDCELRRSQPAIAFILFGPNDVMRMTADQFAVQLRLIVDAVIANGTIPVLSTFSYAPDAPLWWQSVDFNQRIIALADEFDLPLINLWLAARTLPDYGLDVDRVHMLQTGFPYLTFEGNNVAFRGAALRNLLTVTMLDAIATGLANGFTSHP
ncbi:MAG: SGNH/GDSL hydrolase family protein, partial [Anaerolinea sp.]|nr:SGNH/GDSL hydrolase family protein [Anaerolinea sp.]